MPIIEIEVKNKIAHSPADSIVCGNSDFQIKFTFDEEWNAYEPKTARFVYNGIQQDVVFNGDVCDVPIISGANVCAVGVFAGDLHTTTPALVSCLKSILCAGGLPADPKDDIYIKIIEMVSDINEKATAAEAAAAAAEDAAKKAAASGGVDLSSYYTKSEIDAALGAYIDDVNALIGGDD